MIFYFYIFYLLLVLFNLFLFFLAGETSNILVIFFFELIFTLLWLGLFVGYIHFELILSLKWICFFHFYNAILFLRFKLIFSFKVLITDLFFEGEVFVDSWSLMRFMENLYYHPPFKLFIKNLFSFIFFRFLFLLVYIFFIWRPPALEGFFAHYSHMPPALVEYFDLERRKIIYPSPAPWYEPNIRVTGWVLTGALLFLTVDHFLWFHFPF